MKNKSVVPHEIFCDGILYVCNWEFIMFDVSEILFKNKKSVGTYLALKYSPIEPWYPFKLSLLKYTMELYILFNVSDSFLSIRVPEEV